MLSSNIKRQVPFLVGGILIIYITKPSLFFKLNGKPRLYGFGYDEEGYKKTLYTFQFIILIMALIIYYRF
jgi:hypothetical protein